MLALAAVASIVGMLLGVHLDAVSLVEVENNRDEKKLEIAIRFYPEPLEKALSLDAKRKISIAGRENIDGLLQSYVAKHLVIRASESGKRDSAPVRPPTRLTWVGYEKSSKEVWVYVEIAWEGLLEGKYIRDTMLMDVNEEQVNTVNFTEGERIATCVLTRRAPEGKVTLKAKNRPKSSAPGPGIKF